MHSLQLCTANKIYFSIRGNSGDGGSKNNIQVVIFGAYMTVTEVTLLTQWHEEVGGRVVDKRSEDQVHLCGLQ